MELLWGLNEPYQFLLSTDLPATLTGYDIMLENGTFSWVYDAEFAHWWYWYWKRENILKKNVRNDNAHIGDIDI